MHVVKLERRLENINSGGLKRPPPAEAFQQLKDEVSLQVEENKALKKSFRAGLLGKEEEIAILRASAAEQKGMYEKALRDLKRQVKQTAGQTQARGIHQASSAHAEELLQYQKANSQLKRDLSELQERFKTLVMRCSEQERALAEQRVIDKAKGH